MPKLKLSFEKAEHIRALYALTPMSQRQLANEYGVSQENIAAITQYRIYVPEHMKAPKGPNMCRLGLHDMDAPNGRNTDGICRLCLNARLVRQRKDNPEKYGRVTTAYNRKVKGVIGIDLRARKTGPCEICKKHCDPLHLDHCHEFGYFRGWLCGVCNTRLGVLELKEWMDSANAYLDRTRQDIQDKLAEIETGQKDDDQSVN